MKTKIIIISITVVTVWVVGIFFLINLGKTNSEITTIYENNLKNLAVYENTAYNYKLSYPTGAFGN